MTDRKTISRRPMFGLKGRKPALYRIGECGAPLSAFLDAGLDSSRDICLVGTLEEMSRAYVEEPLAEWEFAKAYAHKHRSPVYRHKKFGVEKSVKLISHREGWFPGVGDIMTAASAWDALESEWRRSTGLPLLSSPRATGIALLWESLPKGVEFPCLPDDLAKLIRSVSPQHRIEYFNFRDKGALISIPDCCQYDGRWMYAAMCSMDRLPVGRPRETNAKFDPYRPGWYYVQVVVPDGWRHVGLVPVKGSDGAWEYPSEPGRGFETWACEPELTLAVQNDWRVEVAEGWVFDKGRPLDGWASRLIDLRESFQGVANSYGATPSTRAVYRYAAAACRQILNHTIGAIHRGSEYERERIVPDSEWRDWRRENAAWFDRNSPEKVEGGWLVSEYERRDSKFDIFMPHWSATVYSLARARVAQWALKCDPATLVKIHGDAIYSTAELPFEDNGRLGQLRRKA